MFDAIIGAMLMTWLRQWIAKLPRLRVQAGGWLLVSWGAPSPPLLPPRARARRMPAGEVGEVLSGAVERRPRSGAQRP